MDSIMGMNYSKQRTRQVYSVSLLILTDSQLKLTDQRNEAYENLSQIMTSTSWV